MEVSLYLTVLTNLGIDEVEGSLLQSDVPTIYFPANIRRFVDVDESLIEFIKKVRKARRDYLCATYQVFGGRTKSSCGFI